MKNMILIFFLFILGLSSCQYKNKDSENNPPLVPVTESVSRLEMQDLSVIQLRTKTESGLMTVIDSDFIDIAKINSPKFTNSFGDVQATAVEVKDTKAYIVYNVSGNEVGGAIDIVDISTPSEPKILNTYLTEQYEFSDVVVRNNLLYASGYQKDVGAILMILSIANDKLEVVKVQKINGIYATDLSLFGNTLSIISGETGGLTELDISNPTSPLEISFTELPNGLSVSANDYFSFYVKGNNDTSVSSKSKTGFLNIFDNQINSSVLYSKKIALLKSEAPTRIKLKNSILYSLNAKSKMFDIIDASQSGKTGLIDPLKTIGSLSVSGTPNGFDLDQQIVFLALGEEGVQIADIKEVSHPLHSGTLVFKNDNGSSNNIWVKETINDQKYVFIAHGRQGVRIITKKKTMGSDKKVVISARGDKNIDGAKFQIKINGLVVKTQEVSENFEQYVYTHSSNLTANDKVEIVFVNNNNVKNPNLKRNLFINYLWVADKYCYQKPLSYKDTLNDFGFFENGDTLSYNKGTCESSQHNTPSCSSNQHIEENICVDNKRSCLFENGVGTQTWHSECGWSLCYPTSCNTGFLLSGGVCTQKVCSKGTKTSCSILNGQGEKTCLDSELGYSLCSPISCDQGFVLQNGTCVQQVCIPSSSSSCVISNGNGLKTCSSDGMSYGSCTVSSCNAGFKKEGNSCVEDPTYCSVNGSTKSCSCANGTGVLTCNNNTWSTSCTPTSCNSGYTLQNGVCVQQICSPNSTATCSIQNGTGTKTCSSNGLSYNSCVPSSCNSGYTLQNGICVQQICSPNSTTNCSVQNGTGSKKCSSDGLSYGSCTTLSCNNGFYLNNGSCLPQVCTPNSTQSCTVNNFVGVKTCNSNGSELSSCVSTGSCQSGYTLQNGQCVAQICSPNVTSSCLVDNGVGVKTCNSNGLSYGACNVTSCNLNYILDNGLCKPKVCEPNSVKSCTENNGLGVQICDNKGLSLSSCQITSCNIGYDKKFTPSNSQYSFCSNEYEDCITNADSVTVKYGKNGTYTEDKILSQTFACSNSVFGDPLFGTVKECLVKGTFSCELRVCKSNEYDNGTKCVPQVCTPNSTQSCTVNNFVGVKTCNSNGSQLSSCVSTGVCESGYTLQNGQCVAQICNPNSTASCSIQNGTGAKSCSADGLSWGYCNPISCSSGFSPVYTTSSSELILNGNFSQSSPLIGSSNLKSLSSVLSSPYGTWDIYSSLPSWSLTQGSGIEIWSEGNGSGFIELDGNENYKTSQSLVLENLDYVVKADYLPRTNNIDDNKVSIYVSSNSVNLQQMLTFNQKSSSQSNWKTGAKVFRPLAGSYNLTIAGEGSSTSYGGFIDNVSVKKITGDGICSPLVCSPKTTKTCSINNFIGSQTCNESGSAWGSCVSSGICEAGFVLKNGACQAQVCSPNSTTACSVSNGTGSKTCSSDGLSYGSCNVTSCNSGYALIGGVCKPKLCSPNSTTSCSVSNGTGLKTCSSDGMSYGSCNVTSCSAGYKLSNNSCVIDSNYCSVNGSTKSCGCSNGSGVQTCTNNQWSSTCTPKTCNSGYVLKNGQCVAQICTPKSSLYCFVSNGTGAKTCSTDGLSWGSCLAKSCNNGYILDKGQCVKPMCNNYHH